MQFSWWLRASYTWRSGFALFCLSASPIVALAQQGFLWQGYVKPNQINVYANPSTADPVTRVLKQGDTVNVVLEINVMGDRWCRVALPGHADPLGVVLCFNLDRNSTPNSGTRAQAAPQLTSTSATSSGHDGTTANSGVLTNEDVMAMTKAGLPPEILVAKIKTSACSFDTSPQELQHLKAAGILDSVILAMVQASLPDHTAKDENVKPTATTPDPSPAPRKQNLQSASKPCVILKRMGPADEITSHFYSFGIRGKQFQFVEGTLPPGVSFHGRLTDHDVRDIESKGGKVVVIEPKYSVEQLDHARKECEE